MNTKKLEKKINMNDLYRNGFYFIKNCMYFKEASYLSDLSRNYVLNQLIISFL